MESLQGCHMRTFINRLLRNTKHPSYGQDLVSGQVADRTPQHLDSVELDFQLRGEVASGFERGCHRPFYRLRICDHQTHRLPT